MYYIGVTLFLFYFSFSQFYIFCSFCHFLPSLVEYYRGRGRGKLSNQQFLQEYKKKERGKMKIIEKKIPEILAVMQILNVNCYPSLFYYAHKFLFHIDFSIFSFLSLFCILKLFVCLFLNGKRIILYLSLICQIIFDSCQSRKQTLPRYSTA